MRISGTPFSRRRFLQTGAVAAGSVLLAACGQATPAQPASGAPAATSAAPAGAAPTTAAKPAAAAKAASGQIVFMDGIAGHAKLAQEWGDKFMAQNSGVKVDVQFIAKADEMVQQMLVQMAGGNPPFWSA